VLYNILHNIKGKVVDLLGKPEGKKPLGRPRRRSEDNIKKEFKKQDEGRGLY
jgi:hypothetical protein